MTSINAHTLALLEFSRIRAQVSDLCLSEEGRSLLAEQTIGNEARFIDDLLDFTGDLRRLIEAAPLPQLDFPPVHASLPALHKEGTVAEGLELAAIGSFLGSAMRLRAHLTGQPTEEKSPRSLLLADFAAEIPELSSISGRILHLLNPDGSVNEERVPELKRIRREIQNLHNDVDSLTSRYLTSDRGLWQADVPTQRDGRTVLPLKASHRGRVQGIVHEVSSTGATVFIEPMDIVEKNNQIVEQDNRYRREVHRILKELTALVHDEIHEVERLVERIAFFDTIYARTRYAQLNSCSRAGRSERVVRLNSARHPLLGRKAVPIDFELGDKADIMVITGANAGGKTVTLKTVGLLALMNQWGMQIPALDGCELPLFDRVLVDIGDDQSISDSLSTFSGHMKSLSTIIEESNKHSLVLLDEIGSGTDPAEGSALAMATLDHLLERESLVIATTHHGLIKRYGLSKPRITNASVAFDAQTLSPTYELVIGVPGESHALEIAARSRIPEAILDRAKAYVEEERTDLDRAIEELADQHREIERQQNEISRLQEELRDQTEALERRENRVAEAERRVRDKELDELGDFLRESRRSLENLVRELRTGEITREKTRSVKGFIDKIEEKLADEERESRKPPAAEREEVGVIEEGAEVFVGKNQRRGTVIRKLRDGNWLVAVNTLRMTLSEQELRPARTAGADREKAQGLSVVVSETGSGESPAFELDLRGMRLEEALEALERQLDRALLSGMSEFSVIHGKGEGILRQGVQRVLKGSKAVSEFYFSPPETGGFGKTIVKLGK